MPAKQFRAINPLAASPLKSAALLFQSAASVFSLS
jgi:hypothetical protein